jgi:hypothetical protein
VKTSKEFEAGLRKPGTQVHTIELTPELKQRLEKTSMQLIDWLTMHTKGPPEAYMVLEFTMDALRESMGIVGTATFNADDDTH